AIFASLFLYCAGLLNNDFFDLAEDRRQRPSRPLPSGLVKPSTVILVAIILTLLGMASAFFAGGRQGLIVAAILAGSIFLYNVGGKRLAVIGAICMGMCRGLSVLLGACALGQPIFDSSLPPAVIFAVSETLYIAAVTVIAARETIAGPVGVARLLPVAAIIAWLAAFHVSFMLILVTNVVTVAIDILAAGWVISCCRQLKTADPAVVQRTIGKLIRVLLLVQAGVAAATGVWEGYVVAGVLLAFWPLSAVASRKFYAS
ncbi:MAG: hypothetical protein EHM48_02205, partial [Planctomycetaceae bacterium]